MCMLKSQKVTIYGAMTQLYRGSGAEAKEGDVGVTRKVNVTRHSGTHLYNPCASGAGGGKCMSVVHPG